MTTVGESLAHNAAGPDGRPAVMHVESITVVTPGGELRRASRTAHRELFALVAGGQGLFGALYSVTLDIGSLSRAVNEAAATRSLLVDARRTSAAAAAAARQARCLPRRGAQRCDEWRMALAGVEVRHTLQENDSFLRWARRDYAAVTLHLAEPPVLGVAVRATQLRRSLIDAAIAHGGSFAVSLHAGGDARAGRSLLSAAAAVPRREAAHRSRRAHRQSVVPALPRLFSREQCAVRWAN